MVRQPVRGATRRGGDSLNTNGGPADETGLVAVTGAGGRVGSALVAQLRGAGRNFVEWSRPDYNLDDPGSAARLAERDRPALVYHAAAWTDVDGCARDPALCRSRNGEAVADLSRACARLGSGLVFISTNEVFSGLRDDGVPYSESDPAEPGNPYGWAKLNGEMAVHAAFADHPNRAWIVRTSWVFGPPGNDFPRRIAAAARAVSPGQALSLVGDEIGRPTSAADLAAALLMLPGTAEGGTYHLANAGRASRLEWARRVFDGCGIDVAVDEISLDQFSRPSRPPRWGVLDTSRADALGLALRPWQEALDAYLDEICAD